MHWLADAGSGAIDLNVFAQYGVLGLVSSGLIWFARGAHQRERDRGDRLEGENQRLNGMIIDRVIPALLSATRATEEAGNLLSAMQRERELARLARQEAARIKTNGDNA